MGRKRNNGLSEGKNIIGQFIQQGIASMKNSLAEWNSWLRRRIRMYIWKQWKKPRTRYRNLLKPGIPEKQAWMAAMLQAWLPVHRGERGCFKRKTRMRRIL